MAMLWITLSSSTCVVCRICKMYYFIDIIRVFPRSELFEEKEKKQHI